MLESTPKELKLKGIKLKDTEVITVSGGTIDNIHDKMKKLDRKFRKITICVGTNDCADTSLDLSDIVPAYERLIDTALTMVPDSTCVVLSSVPPRANKLVQDFIEDLNDTMVQIAKQRKITYVSHDKTFKEMSGQVNEALLLQDGLHLTYRGTNKFAKNLHLDILPPHDHDVCRSRKMGHRSANSASSFRGQKRASANRNDLPIDSDHNVKRTPMPRVDDHQYRRAWRGPTRQNHIGRPPRHHNRENDRQPREVWQNVTTGRKNQQRTCWYCGESNHMHHTCRHGGPLVCRTCGCEGHKAKFCFNNRY